ncbi:MAG: helix-turn-helix domain-containing protein [Defluviitaleaceae bacterium]|nr:helix-turn-helix domain-containing protein [Defluviitaleaceae bacterium]
MNYIALGRRMREERLKLNLTQEMLADDVGLTTAYIGQIERGERSLALDKLVLIVNRLGVTIDYILSDSVAIGESISDNLMLQLFSNRSEDEKMVAVNMIKTMFSFLDENRKP